MSLDQITAFLLHWNFGTCNTNTPRVSNTCIQKHTYTNSS